MSKKSGNAPASGLRILCFGETVWENHSGKMLLGGSALSLAARFTAMGNSAVFFSRAGTDNPGDAAVAKIKEHGIDTTYVQRDARRPTARATVTGAAGYNLDPGASGFISLLPIVVNSISRISFDAFCFETVIQTFSESASALSALLECIETREVLYDFNLRGNMYGKRIFESSLKMATIARCNEEESRTISTILFGKMLKPAEFAQAISKTYYVPVVCVRLSDGGTIICQAGKAEHIRLPAGLKPGPGPLFNAELLGALLCGASPVEGAKSAMAGSSLHVSAAEPQG